MMVVKERAPRSAPDKSRGKRSEGLVEHRLSHRPLIRGGLWLRNHSHYGDTDYEYGKGRP
jgi:hypothetical protein